MSILEVAKEAGVSHTTVSRVINNHPLVAPNTAMRVRHAMRRLNYTSPRQKRGPRPRSQAGIHHGAVGLLLASTTSSFVGALSTPIIEGVGVELNDRGLRLMVSHLREGQLCSLVMNGGVDGVLLYGNLTRGLYEPRLVERLRRLPLVSVMGGSDPGDVHGDRVEPDNASIGQMALEYLQERGHEHVAVLASRMNDFRHRERVDAFEASARRQGLRVSRSIGGDSVPDELHPARPVSVLSEPARELFSGQGDKPTGVFVPRDQHVPAVYRVLRELGLEPGHDVEFVSCNNAPILDALEPRPATMDLQPGLIGREAVRRLLDRLTDTHEDVRTEIKIKPRLVAPHGGTHDA